MSHLNIIIFLTINRAISKTENINSYKFLLIHMNYFFEIFSQERPKLKIQVLFTAHTQICTVWGTETYFVK